VLSGEAKVVISGTALRTELYDPRSRDKVVKVTLKGTIRSGRVEAVAI